MSGKRKCKKHLPLVRPVGVEPTRRKGHQSLNLACLPKFHHGHINVFNFRKATPERPASAPSGSRTHTPQQTEHRTLIPACLPFHHGHYTPSQSRRTTGNYGNTIARPPARAQADNTRPHRNIRHNKQRTITARNHTMLPVDRAGLEPATSRLVTRRSIH